MRFGTVRKMTALALLCAVLFALPSCYGRERFVQSVLLNDDVRGAYEIAPEHHFCRYSPETLVAESGSRSFWFDEKTGSVGVSDDASQRLWSALPTFSNRTAAVLRVEAFNGTATYALNSQDHAVAYGTFSSEKTEDGVRITFAMSDRPETARKQPDELKAGDIYVSVPLVCSFANGRLTASVDMAQVVCAPGLILYHVSLLPDFGAVNAYGGETLSASAGQAAGQPFILLPDGCGALVYPDSSGSDYPELDFCVYGSDDSLGRVANVGAFGAMQGGAFVCVLTNGEELAEIRTLRESDGGETLFPVYAQYGVTPVYNHNGNMAYGVMYEGTLSQTYAFLTGGSACFSGMASAVREMLIYAGRLSAAPLTQAAYPVNIALTGSVEGNKETLLTDFEQSEALLRQLRAKGLDRVNLVLNGFLTGGLENAPANASHPDACVGTDDSLEALCDYAEKQGYDVYLAKDLLTAAGGTALRELTGKRRTFVAQNPFPSVGKTAYAKRFVSWTRIPDNAAAFLEKMENSGATGFALSDLNEGLVADYTLRTLGRSAASSKLSEIAAAFSAIKKLLVNGGNFNTLRCADVITGLPCETAVTPTGQYRAVPFLQMLLHGSYCYSGAPAVSAQTDKLALLRAVEYGAAPYFSWTGSSRSDRCADSHIAACAEFCARAARELADLFPLRMTDHYAVAEGVYCTEYGSGVRVYVNYNHYSVAVGTISVPPYDFLRID